MIVEKPSYYCQTKLIQAPKQKLPDGFGELELLLDLHFVNNIAGSTEKVIVTRLSLQESGKKCIFKEEKKYFLHIRIYKGLEKIGEYVDHLNKNVVFNEDKFENHYFITRNPTYFDKIIVSFKMVEESIVTQNRIPILKSSLNSDFKQLHNTEDLHDVVFVVNSVEFKAHKVILMARSPVFQAMFLVDMIEKKENKVTIKNIEPEVFAQLLKFIYTDEIDMDRASIELGHAANMYSLLRLLSICNNHLQKTIDITNAIAIVKYSIDVVCDELKDFAAKFVMSHADQFSEEDILFVKYLEPRKKQCV